MKTLIKALTLVLAILPCSNAIAQTTYYWRGPSATSGQGVASVASNWSTSATSYVASATAPSTNDSSVVIKHIDLATGGIGGLMQLAVGTTTWGSVINEATNGTSMDIYDQSTGSTLVLTTLTQNNTSTLSLRKRKTGTAFNARIGTVNVLNGSLYFGNQGTSVGEVAQSTWVESLTVDNIVISGTAASVDAAKLFITTKAFTLNNSISITNGTLVYGYNAANTPALGFTPSNFYLDAGKKLILNNNSRFQFSTSATYSQNARVNIDTVEVAGTSGAEMILYSSADPSLTMAFTIGNLNFTANDSSFTLSEFNSDISIGKISTDSIINANLAIKSTYESWAMIGEIEGNFTSIVLGAAVEILGKFTNTNTATDSKALKISLSENGLIVDKEFENQGAAAVRFDGADSSSTNTVFMDGGLTATSTSSQIRTSYDTSITGGGTRGDTTIYLRGNSGTFTCSSRIFDFGQGSDIAAMTTGAKLNIVKDGENTQYLRGDNTIRGYVTVNAGTLYIKANGANLSTIYKNNWGIGKLTLNGGGVGPTNTTTEVSKLIAHSFEWESGNVIMDIGSTANYDSIKLVGDATLAADQILVIGSGTHNFLFTLLSGYQLDTSYDLITWDASYTPVVSADDFTYEFADSALESEIEAIFSVSSTGVSVIFQQIVPEPATVAALMGFAALLFAAYKRRKRG